MSYINKKKEGIQKKSHLNFMEGPSYSIEDPLMRLRIAGSSCFFGEPQYYHRDSNDKRRARYSYSSGLSNEQVEYLAKTLNAIDPQEWRTLSPKELMEKAIDDALNFNPEKTLLEAIRLRIEDYIRTTPQVILVRAANTLSIKGTGLVQKYGYRIIRRGDEPAVQLAYQLSEYGKPIPNSLKKVWKRSLESLPDYNLAKYRMESRTVKTIDVIRLCHANSKPIDLMIKDKLKITGKTWESIISQEGSTKESWKKAIELMGHMALLRNIRNLSKAEVDSNLYLDKLKNGVKTGYQLPFRYFSAYNANREFASPQILDAIEECLEISLENMPHFSGRVMSLCDNSGSAHGTFTGKMGSVKISDIANLSAIITGKISDEGYIGIFGDRLKTQSVRKKTSIFEQLINVNRIAEGIGQSTENGIWLFWDNAIKTNEHWDSVFIFSDMQAGHGGLYGINKHEYSNYIWGDGNDYDRDHYIDVPKLINHYRSKVNPNVNVYLVQVAGYQDTIIPEFYKKTYILGGWGEGLWKFASSMSNINVERKN